MTPLAAIAAKRGALTLRGRVVRAVRRFFDEHGYLEVETPCRIPAPAPERHIAAIPADGWFLQTSPELCMKRLLAAGYPRIYQLCKCFRQNERGARHLPELTLLEWYRADSDYRAMMDECEALLCSVVARVAPEGRLAYQGTTIDLRRPWPRLTVRDAFARFGSLSMQAALEQDRFDEIMALEIEPRLDRGRPLFLHDYPAACGSLARLAAADPTVAERFELYLGGLELCNAFSELTDAGEQRRRFETELERRRRAGERVYPLPETFLAALPHMPTASGNALGIDRLVMLFADADTIDAVVAFTPQEL